MISMPSKRHESSLNQETKANNNSGSGLGVDIPTVIDDFDIHPIHSHVNMATIALFSSFKAFDDILPTSVGLPSEHYIVAIGVTSLSIGFPWSSCVASHSASSELGTLTSLFACAPSLNFSVTCRIAYPLTLGRTCIHRTYATPQMKSLPKNRTRSTTRKRTKEGGKKHTIQGPRCNRSHRRSSRLLHICRPGEGSMVEREHRY